MTEEEAKTKWCPFARVATSHADGRPLNRLGSDSGVDPPPINDMVLSETCCIGSACMAWRWASVGMQYSHAGHGYCGIAGKP